jgi:Holliday junction resolvasome RuvABC endonuclease subunit
LRFVRYLKHLRELIAECRKDYGSELVVAYEEVRHSSSTDAAHIHGGLRAMIHVVCCCGPISEVPIPTGTWKRLVVGNGAAKQAEYVPAISEILGLTLNVKKDEDEAAALGVGLAALLQAFYDEQIKTKNPRSRRSS